MIYAWSTAGGLLATLVLWWSVLRLSSGWRVVLSIYWCLSSTVLIIAGLAGAAPIWAMGAGFGAGLGGAFSTMRYLQWPPADLAVSIEHIFGPMILDGSAPAPSDQPRWERALIWSVGTLTLLGIAALTIAAAGVSAVILTAFIGSALLLVGIDWILAWRWGRRNGFLRWVLGVLFAELLLLGTAISLLSPAILTRFYR